VNKRPFNNKAMNIPSTIGTREEPRAVQVRTDLMAPPEMMQDMGAPLGTRSMLILSRITAYLKIPVLESETLTTWSEGEGDFVAFTYHHYQKVACGSMQISQLCPHGQRDQSILPQRPVGHHPTFQMHAFEHMIKGTVSHKTKTMLQ
jgi:hypothetical protein